VSTYSTPVHHRHTQTQTHRHTDRQTQTDTDTNTGTDTDTQAHTDRERHGTKVTPLHVRHTKAHRQPHLQLSGDRERHDVARSYHHVLQWGVPHVHRRQLGRRRGRGRLCDTPHLLPVRSPRRGVHRRSIHTTSQSTACAPEPISGHTQPHSTSVLGDAGPTPATRPKHTHREPRFLVPIMAHSPPPARSAASRSQFQLPPVRMPTSTAADGGTTSDADTTRSLCTTVRRRSKRKPAPVRL